MCLVLREREDRRKGGKQEGSREGEKGRDGGREMRKAHGRKIWKIKLSQGVELGDPLAFYLKVSVC